VVVGGLAVSTVFTVLLVPAVFSLVMDVRVWLRAKFLGEGESDKAVSAALR
jgi:hypothetical protein